MTLKAAYATGKTDIDFFARNTSGQWWNGSAFETYNAANLADYRITAAETPAGSGLYQGTEPSGATEYELRYRGATLALSVVVAGPAETDAVQKTNMRSYLGGVWTDESGASATITITEPA